MGTVKTPSRRTAACAALIVAGLVGAVHAQDKSKPAVGVGRSELGGAVAGRAGPEAGVWVIAETRDLPTQFAKIVVTDDAGRFLVPDLPKANYSVWVRGYGLTDTRRLPRRRAPGSISLPFLRSTRARRRRSLPTGLLVRDDARPAAREFPLEQIKSQGEWLNIVKTGACQSCHALGTPGTRTMPKGLGSFRSFRRCVAPAPARVRRRRS